MTKLKWHNETRKIDELLPFESNPRQLTDEQAEDLKKSLAKFDLVEIPAIDTDNKIIAGHQRIKVLQLIGRGKEEIDVRVPNRKLSAKEFKEYNIRSNKNTGQWDFDIISSNGSGSTLIACEKSQRKCYGIEMDPKYCDVIVKRWEEYTGRKAVKNGKKD